MLSAAAASDLRGGQACRWPSWSKSTAISWRRIQSRSGVTRLRKQFRISGLRRLGGGCCRWLSLPVLFGAEAVRLGEDWEFLGGIAKKKCSKDDVSRMT